MKKITAFFCALFLFTGMTIPSWAGGTNYLPTNIPKSFPLTKSDPSFTTVNFWYSLTGRYPVIISNICNWYNMTEGKKKKVYVKPVFQGDYDAITVKLQATMQSKNSKSLPDLAQLSAQGAFSVKDTKYVVYMEDMIKADPSFKILNKLNKATLWSCSYKGKLLGMPFSNSAIVLHYNVDAFKSVGLDPNKPPKTLEEYAKAAEKLAIKGSGSRLKRYGCSDRLSAYHLSTLIPSMKNGTAFQFDNEDGHSGVPTKLACAKDGTLKTALTEWKKVLDTKAVEYTNAAPRLNYQAGICAMWMGTMVHYPTMQEYFASVKDKSKVFTTAMAPIPKISANDAKAEAVGGSGVYMFNRGSETSKNATWDFVKFLTSVDVSAYWYAESGYFPVNDDYINTKYVQDLIKKDPMRMVPLDIRKDSSNYYKFQEPWIPAYSVYLNTVGDQTSLLAQDKQTVDKTVTNITKKAEDLLKTYWNANK